MSTICLPFLGLPAGGISSGLPCVYQLSTICLAVLSWSTISLLLVYHFWQCVAGMWSVYQLSTNHLPVLDIYTDGPSLVGPPGLGKFWVVHLFVYQLSTSRLPIAGRLQLSKDWWTHCLLMVYLSWVKVQIGIQWHNHPSPPSAIHNP